MGMIKHESSVILKTSTSRFNNCTITSKSRLKWKPKNKVFVYKIRLMSSL